jgi:hypothetical protein
MMFGGMGDMMSLLGNVGKLSKEYKNMMEQMKTQTVEGSAGGEMVKVTINGLGELVDIKLSDELVKGGDVEMLEDLIKSAFAAAIEKSRTLAQGQMGKLTEMLPPGLISSLMGHAG